MNQLFRKIWIVKPCTSDNIVGLPYTKLDWTFDRMVLSHRYCHFKKMKLSQYSNIVDINTCSLFPLGIGAITNRQPPNPDIHIRRIRQFYTVRSTVCISMWQAAEEKCGWRRGSEFRFIHTWNWHSKIHNLCSRSAVYEGKELCGFSSASREVRCIFNVLQCMQIFMIDRQQCILSILWVFYFNVTFCSETIWRIVMNL